MRTATLIVLLFMLGLPLLGQEVKLPPTVGLVPFVLPWDDGAPGPTDLSSWNHCPAGKFGPLTTKPDGHIYAGEERIRFFGVNMCFGACIPTHAQAERIAARLAKFGVNVVRFHHMDGTRFPNGLLQRGGTNNRDLDPEAMDRLGYFVAQLKARGIYINLNLLVTRTYTAADGLPTETDAVKGKMNGLLAYIHEPSLELQREYARRLLGYRNPHTGLTFAEDPAVAFVEISNENGLLNYWFAPQRVPHADALPGVYGEALRARWNAWLLAKYGAAAAWRAAWGVGEAPSEDGTVPPIAFEGWKARPIAVRRDWIAFLWDLEDRYYTAMADCLRREVGTKALLTGSTAASSTPNIMAKLDVIDNHLYANGIDWKAGHWNYGPRKFATSLESQFGGSAPGGALRWCAAYRVAGKPFSITEFNESAPNTLAGEAPLFLALFGALQDWDALYMFTYQHTGVWDKGVISGLNLNEHTTKMANMPVAAAMFRRGDVAANRDIALVPLSRARELDAMVEKGKQWNLANGFHAGLKGEAIILQRRTQVLVDPVASRLERAMAALTAGEGEVIDNPDDGAAVTTVASKRFVSTDGSVVWDATEAGRGFTTVGTPRMKAAMGMTAGRTLDLGGVRAEMGPAIDSGGTLALVLLDGESFAAPRRALLVATGRVENSGMQWVRINPDGPGKPMYELDSWGKAPTVVEPVSARLTVPTTGRTVRVYALDGLGQRGPAVPVDAAAGIAAAFSIGPPHGTLWYEVVWE